MPQKKDIGVPGLYDYERRRRYFSFSDCAHGVFRIAESKGKLAAQAIPTQQELEERKEKRLRELEEEEIRKRK